MDKILASTLLVALVTGIFSVYAMLRGHRLRYITEEREKWRESIRKIADELGQLDYNIITELEIKQILVRLKTRINAYGKELSDRSEKGAYYLKDGHIWEQISKIESIMLEKKENKEIKKEIDHLITFLSLLLKYDWERSKREVEGNKYFVIGQIISMLAIIADIAYNIYVLEAKINVISIVLPLTLFLIPLSVKLIFDERSKGKGNKSFFGIIKDLFSKEPSEETLGFAIIFVVLLSLCYTPLLLIDLNIKNDFNNTVYIVTQLYCFMAMMLGTGFMREKEREEKRQNRQYQTICEEIEKSNLSDEDTKGNS
ncbi:MAG: hypothetical protein ACRCU3_00050 [Eubacteriaceae bacterium]